MSLYYLIYFLSIINKQFYSSKDPKYIESKSKKARTSDTYITIKEEAEGETDEEFWVDDSNELGRKMKMFQAEANSSLST